MMFNVSFCEEFQNQLRQGAQDAVGWKRNAMLQSLVVQGPRSLAFPDGYLTVRPYIQQVDIPGDNKEKATGKIYQALCSAGVIKMESFNLSGHAHEKELDKFKGSLKGAVRDFLKDRGRSGDKLKKAVGSIFNMLTGHVGTLRELPTGKTIASFKSIEVHYFSEMARKIAPIALDDLKCAGFGSFFILEEKKPPPEWWEIGAVVLLGVAQIAAGVLAKTFIPVAGELIGDFLINTGVDDICFAVQCAIAGEFSWSAYWDHKKESMITSAISAGCFAAFKFAGRAAKLKSAKKAWQVQKMSKAQRMAKVSQVGAQAGASAMKSAGKQIAITLATTGLTELAGYGIDAALDATTDAYEAQLRTAVTDSVKKMWAEVSKALDKLATKLGREAREVQKVAGDVFANVANASQMNGIMAAFKRFGKPVIDGAAKSMGNRGIRKVLRKSLELGQTAVDLGVAIAQLSTMVEQVVMGLADQLRETAKTKTQKDKAQESDRLSDEDLKRLEQEQCEKLIETLTSQQVQALKSQVLAPVLKTGASMVASKCVDKLAQKIGMGPSVVEQMADSAELSHASLESGKGRVRGRERVQAFLAGGTECTKDFRQRLQDAQHNPEIREALNKVKLQNCERSLGNIAATCGGEGVRIFKVQNTGKEPQFFVVQSLVDSLQRYFLLAAIEEDSNQETIKSKLND